MAPFEILFRIKPRFAAESSGTIPGEELLANARPFELAMPLINRAESYVARILQNKAYYQIGDVVLLRRGRLPERYKFEARMCLCPFKVISVEHPCYMLEKAPGRKYRKPVHVRHLCRYQEREKQHPDGEMNC